MLCFRNSPKFFQYSQRGLAIVELLVAITVGLVLVAAISGLYISTKRTFQTQEAASRNQEAGRVALDILANEIKKAGYVGCSGMVGTNAQRIFFNRLDATNYYAPLVVRSPYSGGVELIRVRGYNRAAKASWDGFPQEKTPDSFSSSDNSHVLVLQALDEDIVGFTSVMASASDVVNVDAIPTQVSQNKGLSTFAIVSDCERADLVAVQNSGMTGLGHEKALGNRGDALSKPYGAGAVGNDAAVGALQIKAFYVGTDKKTGKKSLYQLTRSSPDKAAQSDIQPLIEGIEDMRIYYGFDNLGSPPTGKVVQYRSADEITNLADWNSLVAVRIHLVARTTAQTEIAKSATNVTGEVKRVLEKPQPYRLETTLNNWEEITPADNANYQVYSTVIALRNAAQ